jgi:DNA-binding response OmpR family regulator
MRGLGLGADEYLGKPINFMELRAIVKSMIKLKSYLDRSKPAGDEKQCNNKPHQPPSHPWVLMVEDDEKYAKLLKNYMSGGSYQMAWTKTGEGALEIASGKKFDLILLDILLPNMDGFEVLEHLKEIQSAKDVPIMVVSVLEDLKSKIRAYESGANVYLTKPINRDEVNIRIQNLIMKYSGKIWYKIGAR